MLEKLHKMLEDGTVMELCRQSNIWKTLDVNYFPPRVERLYTDLPDGNRLYLHIIHETDEPCYFHKHRWPSAIYMLLGSYEMGLAYSDEDVSSDDAYKLKTICKLRLSKGSSYEMTEQHGLHYVKPIGNFSMSVMLTGPVYDEKSSEEGKKYIFNELTKSRKNQILGMFKIMLTDL